MKRLAKTALLSLYKYSGAMGAQERIAYWSGRSFLPILLLHRVTDEIPPDGLTVTTPWFRGLCEILRRRFHVVSLSEAVHYTQSGERPPRRTVAVTFDDCYRDNLLAARVLAEHKLPACFFIPTAFPGTDHVFAWDRGLPLGGQGLGGEPGAEAGRLANLSWEEIREMAAMGHEIGSHTVHHVNMAEVSLEEARLELALSKKTLEDQLGRPARWFAYPYGSRVTFPEERLPLVYEVGYSGCFSGYGGFVYPGMKGRILPREPVPCFRSLLNLELHLTGCLHWVYALKRKAGMI
jgi:peptidoglycan/xylan/chitin deacetylase (PgdA/CDA1 family)